MIINTDTMVTVVININPIGISKVYRINPIKDKTEEIKKESL